MIDHIFPDPDPKADRTAVIDFDVIINKAARYGADHAEDPYDVFARIEVMIEEWRTGASCNKQILAVSCSRADNYRKDYLPDYKAHRDKKKATPEKEAAEQKRRDMLRLAFKWADENLKLVRRPRLEADDILGLLAAPDRVMVTIDKDLRTVPGWHYNPDKEDFPVKVTACEAKRFLAKQWLMGDSTDNIRGCPAIGPKKADTFLDTTPEDDWLEGIYELFESKGMTRGQADDQFYAVKILQKGDYSTDLGLQIGGPSLMFPSIENHNPQGH